MGKKAVQRLALTHDRGNLQLNRSDAQFLAFDLLVQILDLVAENLPLTFERRMARSKFLALARHCLNGIGLGVACELFRERNLDGVGPLCEQSLEQIHADIAILGGAGITEAGVWNHNALIVATQRKMIAASERTVFALDSSKFGRKALSLTAPFSSKFSIVTDTKPAAVVVTAIKNAGATLTLAPKSKA